MSQINGTLKRSRKEANFIKRKVQLRREKGYAYIKESIAGNHADLLIPFVRIKKHDRYHRENHYVIKIGDVIITGTIYHSRNQSNYLMSLPKEDRVKDIKERIARLEVHLLTSYVNIIECDPDFKAIAYTIDAPTVS